MSLEEKRRDIYCYCDNVSSAIEEDGAYVKVDDLKEALKEIINKTYYHSELDFIDKGYKRGFSMAMRMVRLQLKKVFGEGLLSENEEVQSS